MAKKKAAAKSKKPVKKVIKKGEGAVEGAKSWREHAEKGFVAKYTGDESARIDQDIFDKFEEGQSMGTIAASIGISVTAVKSRMLKVLLEEVYGVYYVDSETGDPVKWGDKEYGEWGDKPSYYDKMIRSL